MPRSFPVQRTIHGFNARIVSGNIHSLRDRLPASKLLLKAGDELNVHRYRTFAGFRGKHPGGLRASPAWACMMAVLVMASGCGRQKPEQLPDRRPDPSPEIKSISRQFARAVTFNKDVAPILYKHCAACHRASQPAPFSLLEYADARKHASDMAKVTKQRLMPPWLPEPGYGMFEDERRLTEEQIQVIQQWVADGSPEGDPSDAPARPRWVEGWQLWKPDLVVSMPQPYELGAEGPDVYRNFVVRVPLTQRRFVRSVEFRPGNPGIVHHAFIKVDRTGESRRLEELDPEPGFSFMETPGGAQIPEGHFLGWSPGRVASMEREDLAWPLHPGTDLVLQIHLRRSGKPESLQSEVGLYFTDRLPTQIPFKLFLTSRAIDLAPGTKDFEIKDSLRLPVDVDLLAVFTDSLPASRKIDELEVQLVSARALIDLARSSAVDLSGLKTEEELLVRIERAIKARK